MIMQYQRQRKTVLEHIMTSKNIRESELLKRQDYLVVQANDLAKAFGNLTTFQHKILDWCFSYVQQNDKPEQLYYTNAGDIIKHLGLTDGGFNYRRIVKAFKALNEKTAIYMVTEKSDGKTGLLMTSLFDHIEVVEDGSIEFSFHRLVSPYVFQLKERYYSFKLSELSQARSKYTLALMKLWNANSHNKRKDTVVIDASLEEWENWFLGADEDGKPKQWPAGRFFSKCLKTAIDELKELYPDVVVNHTVKRAGRKTAGYIVTIGRTKMLEGITLN